MANFILALNKTLRWEGGETVDTGGYTKWGISQKAFPDLDIKNLTMEQAREIYQRNYWEPIQASLIKNQAVAENLFDFAVNAGVSQAVKTIQKVLGFSRDDIDGKLGNQTLSAINSAGSGLVNQFTQARINFYKNLATRNPNKYGAYLVGWLRRANDFGSAAIAAGSGAVFFFALIAIVSLNKFKRGNR